MTQDIMGELQQQCTVNAAGTGNGSPGFPTDYCFEFLLLISKHCRQFYTL
jgi:hypothetical protein